MDKSGFQKQPKPQQDKCVQNRPKWVKSDTKTLQQAIMAMRPIKKWTCHKNDPLKKPGHNQAVDFGGANISGFIKVADAIRSCGIV